MFARMLFVGLIAAPGLLACSNSRVETVAASAPVLPEVGTTPASGTARSAEAPLLLRRQLEMPEGAALVPPPDGQEFIGRICQVGGPSCLEIDDRPFETCLLSSQDCGEKLRESQRRGENLGPPAPFAAPPDR